MTGQNKSLIPLTAPVVDNVPFSARILLIDDDEFISDIVASTLENTPELVLDLCRTATGGLERIQEALPDLIIMDLGLPDMAGLDLLEILKSESASRKIPVMVLSGANDPKTKVDVYRLGAEWFLGKPFRPHLLKDIVIDLILLNRSDKN